MTHINRFQACLKARRAVLSTRRPHSILAVFLCLFGLSCSTRQPETPPPPPQAPPKPDVFKYLDAFLPQFNGRLASEGKAAFSTRDASGMLFEATSPVRLTSPDPTEELYSISMREIRIGKITHPGTAFLRGDPKTGNLIGVEFRLSNYEEDPIDPDELTDLLTTHYGEPSLTYTEKQGVEWQFSRGKLVMVVERTPDGKKSELVFRLDPLPDTEKVPEKTLDRERD